MALSAFYQANPSAMAEGQNVLSFADRLFPFFIGFELPIGLAGLAMSGVIAVGMSSIDSGINSISAVATTDFIERIWQRPASHGIRLRIAKMIAVLSGMFVILASCLLDSLSRDVLTVVTQATALLVAPIFALVFMAMFVRFAAPVGTTLGAICGFLTALLISFWNPIVEQRWMSATWIYPCALVVSVLVGCMISLVESRLRRTEG